MIINQQFLILKMKEKILLSGDLRRINFTLEAEYSV